MLNHCFYFLPLLLIGCQPATSTLPGYVEAKYQYISSTSSGILKALHVQRGDFIKQGED